MSELRWVLIALGAIVIGVTWAFSSGRIAQWRSRLRTARPRIERREPVLEPPESGESGAASTAAHPAAGNVDERDETRIDDTVGHLGSPVMQAVVHADVGQHQQGCRNCQRADDIRN